MRKFGTIARRLLPRPIKRLIRWLIRPRERLTATEQLVLGSLRRRPTPPFDARKPYDVICFSIVNWDFRWQRPQQMMSEFARQGHRVFFLNPTDFLRRGTHELKELRGGVWGLRLRAPQKVEVYSGIVDQESIETMLSGLASIGATRAVSIVQVPTWSRIALEARRRFGWKVVYDCMDDWSTFPGMEQALVREEHKLVAEADLVAVSAERLVAKWRGKARRLLLVRNAADFASFAQAGPTPLLDKIPRPIAGYFGAIADWFDLDLMEKMARERPRYSFVLIGGRFNVGSRRLKKLKNVYLLGQKPYELMPSYLDQFDACLIPFVVNQVTEATDPVKFYEYVSQGKPVVATRMPELSSHRDLLYLSEDHDEFIRNVDRAIAERDPALRARRVALAQENTWEHRVRALDAAIRELS